MAASPSGGALIALGDAKGFVNVFDTDAKTLKVYFARNKSKILNISFNEDSSWVQCVSLDKILSMSNVENRDDRRVLQSKNHYIFLIHFIFL